MRFPLGFLAAASALLVLCSCRDTARWETMAEFAPGVAFTNDVVPKGPWSVCVARFSRQAPGLDFCSTHAFASAPGLSPLTAQLNTIPSDLGQPLAAINGDFYQREREYAGDPRGLQIIEREVISAPAGTASVWFDAAGAPHSGTIKSAFAVVWPDGSQAPIGLNEERRTNALVLFTPAGGASTRTTAGIELHLERDGTNDWLPLALGRTYRAKVSAVRDKGNSALTNGVAVLSIPPGMPAPPVSAGAIVTLVTTTTPALENPVTAISGGPILIKGGKRLKVDPAGLFDPKSYSARSMFERHPRTAVGWNERHVFFVQVDGRHPSSAGMTLEELGKYMAGIGCTDAVNLDGGGSATFWCNGKIANRPCDGFERPIANALVAVRRKVETAQTIKSERAEMR